LLHRACQIKADPTIKPLAGKSVALLFDKPSLRTLFFISDIFTQNLYSPPFW